MSRILIVEDEESFSDPLSYLLGKEGFDVEVVDNGSDAWWSSIATGQTSSCLTCSCREHQELKCAGNCGNAPACR